MNHGTILDVRQLTKSYPNGGSTLTVLKEISFSLATGATCAILGPSGSGKTTWLGLCAGCHSNTSHAVARTPAALPR